MNSTTLRMLSVLREAVPLFDQTKAPKGFTETLDLVFHDGSFLLDRERLNILLSYWHLPPMERPFFLHYFKKNIQSIDEFKAAFQDFIVDALWHFGDLERAYVKLSQLKELEDFFRHHRFDISYFKERLPWNLVEEIQPSDRGYLGYVSGQRPRKEAELLTLAEEVIKEIEEHNAVYRGNNVTTVSDRVLSKLSQRHPEIRQKIIEVQALSALRTQDLFSSANLESNKKAILDYKKTIDETITKVERLKEIGKRNQEHYLRNIESIDVYVATSMRNDEEYHDMYEFVSRTFNDTQLKELNLRYFDPTLCYCDSRIDKGIIECLLVRSTKATIYCAQDGDTFGKDSELAATLAQGKPVIVYVPMAKESDHSILKLDPDKRKAGLADRKSKLDARANTFKEYHPLGLQVGLYDGVARGVIVVRTPEECAKILRKTLTNALEVDIKFEQHGIVLREKETRSVLRVMTGWGVLSSCFWNQFSKTQTPKAGLPE